MRMDNFDGKEFLAQLRGEDFAHAGERQAIDLVFQTVAQDPDRRVLDAGCGRGGTANYVNKQGWGNVSGVDIDAESIAYAQLKYPHLEFRVCDICEVHNVFPSSFDLLYNFNAFYAVQDKQKGLRSLRAAARQGAQLLVFDYVIYKPNDPLPEVMDHQRPATLDEFAALLDDAGWKQQRLQNLDEEYIRWYTNFLRRFDDPLLKRAYPNELIERVREKYAGLLRALEQGSMGGLLIVAEAISR
jgi:SAM-dependent methyltransferase